MHRNPRSLGLRLITGYKLLKAPLVLLLALWLSFAPRSAEHVASHIAHELSEGGVTLARLARWMNSQLTNKFAFHAAVVAWLDAVTTAIEGLLLLQGSAWAEWIVVIALGALLPFEAISLERHPSTLRVAVLVINALIVAYLVFDRARARAPAS